MNIYRVGGSVRDRLLGIKSQDNDWVVVGATPADLLSKGFMPVGKSFPVFLHPITKEEYALARIEKKTGSGYHGFECYFQPTVTLEEDLFRRDLTINAMAETEAGELIDPYGGQQDLNNKVLRHVSPAFIEDPLRVLRVARFMARYATAGFIIAPETMALMCLMVESKELVSLTSERVWIEFHKALSEKSPEVFIQILKQCGALAVILPEVDCLYGVPQSPEHHPEIDTGVHIELVLTQAAQLSEEPRVRFAALLHDVGKGVTPVQYWPKHPDHEEKGGQLVHNICERLRVPKAFARLARLVAECHGLVYRIFELKAENILSLLYKLDIFRMSDDFSLFLLACQADHQGRPGFENKPYPEIQILKQYAEACLAVDLKTVILPHMTGPQIQEAVFQQRLSAIEHAAIGFQ